MKWMKRVVPGLVLMVLAGMAGAEPVTFRFPDTGLPALPGDEGGAPERQGEVMVTGALLVSPCVLSDYALESQQAGWVAPGSRQVTLALEGCGDGASQFGLSRMREVPLPVKSRWNGAPDAQHLRLNNGVNYLSLTVSPSARNLRLEMDYE